MSAWHDEARALRAGGWKLQEIGERFGVTRERVRQICVGIQCPIDHQALQRKAYFGNPEWREENKHFFEAGRRKPVKRFEGADFIREHYGVLPAREIGRRLGISKNAVIGRARDLGLGKPRHAKPQKIEERA